MLIPTAFISSTCEDLRETGHRDAMRDAALRTRLRPEMQEYWETGDHPPLDECLHRVNTTQVLVLAVAHRYGWIPDGQTRSITWLECAEALATEKKILVYIMSPDYAYDPMLRDSTRLADAFAGDGDVEKLTTGMRARVKGLKDFKDWLTARFVPQSFTTAEDLGQRVEIDLLRWAQSRDLATGSFTNQRDGSLMVRIPAGRFRVGTDRSDDEMPEHLAHLDEFYIAKYPVTNRQFNLFTEQTQHTSPAITGEPDHPVVGVSWQDAHDYCSWAQLSLPSELQWEKAARGIDGRTYPWGNYGPVEVRANCLASERGTTTPVNEFSNGMSPNGCLDMAGNAFEWCHDRYLLQLDDEPSPQDQSTVAADPCFRAVRGGAWNDVSDRCQCAYRGRRWSEYEFNNVGFRVAFSGLRRDTVDSWFGAGNWFCYPDRRSAIGVTRLPELGIVPELIAYIDADEVRHGEGNCPVSLIGASVELRLPISPEECPAWQQSAMIDWVKQSNNDVAPLSGDRVSSLLATDDWFRHRTMTFIVETELVTPVTVQYPMTTVDALDKARYGVGQVCPAGRVKIAFAGDLPERFVSRS
jgi:formylglycine-generating enzyme required for sulfatase activity